MTPTDLSLLVLSIHNGEPLAITSANVDIVNDRHCVILNLGSTPPRIVSVYSNCRYPYFSGHLPDQFLDHLGNLRNGQGRIVFVGEGGHDTTSQEGGVTPYLAPIPMKYAEWTTDSLNSTSSQNALIGKIGTMMTSADLSDMLSVLSPPDTPVPSKVKRSLGDYVQVFKGK